MSARSIYLSVMFAGLIAIHGCSTPVQSETEPPVDFAEFQNSIREVLYKATVMNYSMPVRSLDQMADNVREAYQTTYGDDAQMDVFDGAARRFVQQPRFPKNSVPQVQSETEQSFITKIIQESSKALEAIEALDQLIASGELKEEQTLEAIIAREHIVYLANNSVLLDYLMRMQFSEENTTASLEDEIEQIIENWQRCYEYEQEQPDSLGMIPCGQAQGWWDSWGSCVLGTAGTAIVGAGTLGLAGVAVGTVTLPIFGTVGGGIVGVVVGGVGGALIGAADYCFI